MINEMHKTIGDKLVEKRIQRKAKLEKQLDEVEEWLLDNPYTHPDFEKQVQLRNNLNSSLKLI